MSVKPLLPDQTDQPISAEDWEQHREDIKTRLFDTLGQPPFERNTRQIEVLGEDKLPGYTREKLGYLVGEGDPVYAYLLVPHQLASPAPAVVAMHQYTALGKDEVAGINGDPTLKYGHELAELGYVVLIPDYLTAGERALPGVGAFVSGPFYRQYPGWSMVGKNVEDSMAAVDVLHTLDFVDKARITALGHSHGGHNAIFAAALDERIAVCASNCGLSVFSEEELRMAWCEDGEEDYNYIPALKPYFEAGKEAPFELHEVAALIAPRPWVNISAYEDMAYGKQEFLAEVGVMLNRVYELYGQSGNFAYFMHGNNHSFPNYSRELAYGFVRERGKRNMIFIDG